MWTIYHGSSVQKDSGDIFSKRKHFPGVLLIWWCALITDHDGCSVLADLYSWKRSKELTLAWKAVRLFEVAVMAVKAHGVTVVAGRLISASFE